VFNDRDDRDRNGEDSDYYILEALLDTARDRLYGAEIKRQERKALYETLKQEFEPLE
jgi:hypothetical protein